MPCLSHVRSFGWFKFGSLPFEDNIVSKATYGVYVKCSVIWWLLVLAIKLHVSGSDNSNFSEKNLGLATPYASPLSFSVEAPNTFW